MIHIALLLSLAPSGVAKPATDVAPPQPVAEERWDTLAETLTAPAMAQDEEEPDRTWQGSVTLGATTTRGNTDIQSVSLNADAMKEREGDRFTYGFAYNFSEQDGRINQRRINGSAKYDYFLTEKSYALVSANALRDDAPAVVPPTVPTASLSLRATGGVGYGRKLAEGDEFKLDAEAGVVYYHEDFRRLPGAVRSTLPDEYVAARLAYDAAYTPDKGEKDSIEQRTEIYPSLEDGDDVYIAADTRFKTTLTESMFGQIQWILNWDHTPAAGNKQADHLFILTVGWKF